MSHYERYDHLQVLQMINSLRLIGAPWSTFISKSLNTSYFHMLCTACVSMVTDKHKFMFHYHFDINKLLTDSKHTLLCLVRGLS